MFPSIIVPVLLFGAGAGQPPSRLDRIMPPPVTESQQNELGHRYLELLQLRRRNIEAHIEWHERMLREYAGVMSPRMAKDMREGLEKLRDSLEKTKAREREVANQLGVNLVPLAPMPREKREKRID